MKYNYVDLTTRSSLFLSDGRTRADSLRLPALRAELRRLSIPFEPHDGKSALLDRYQARVTEVAERLRRRGEPVLSLPRAAAMALGETAAADPGRPGTASPKPSVVLPRDYPADHPVEGDLGEHPNMTNPTSVPSTGKRRDLIRNQPTLLAG